MPPDISQRYCLHLPTGAGTISVQGYLYSRDTRFSTITHTLIESETELIFRANTTDNFIAVELPLIN